MRFNNLIFSIFAVSALAACTKESTVDLPTPVPNDNTVVRTNITENTTWTADQVWQLSGRIVVTNGATLTIEPGTLIKGEPGTGANASSLVIARDGHIVAEGTEDAPIIFTSTADELTPADIEVGVFVSPNLNATISGLWGGVIVLGEAPVSASNDAGDVSQVQIEGIPTSDPTGLYGGNNPDHSSGVLRYISIRHGGANIGSGNEINGLTLGGVGRGTTVEHIEIVGNQDDGIEWFGGTVDVSHVVVWNAGDDAIDTDQGWSGTLDNFVVVAPQGHCFELDGPEGTMTASHTLRHGSVLASCEVWESMDLINTDDNSRVVLEQIFFTGIRPGQTINRTSHQAGAVSFSDIFFDVTADQIQDHVNGAVPAGVQAADAPQADLPELRWTWANAAGALSIF
jgi:hypothetical protein